MKRIVAFDANGYPNEDALKCLEEFNDWGDDGKDSKSAKARLLDYAAELWNETYGRVVIDREAGRYAFATGGWSGNEDVLGALNKNVLSRVGTRITRTGGLAIYYTGYDVLPCDSLSADVQEPPLIEPYLQLEEAAREVERVYSDINSTTQQMCEVWEPLRTALSKIQEGK